MKQNNEDAALLQGSMQAMQKSWTNYGKIAQGDLSVSPELFIIDRSPYEEWIWNEPFLEALGDVKGKYILELGCGLGKFSTYLCKKGANVYGIDISEEAVKAANMINALNGTSCQFRTGDIVKLPYNCEMFDRVVGVAVLHHLSKPDVVEAMIQVQKALKHGGKAIFLEPIENSRYFSNFQNIFPAGKKSSGYYRPSILNRKAWNRYLSEMEDRDMTTKELIDAGKIFMDVKMSGHGFITRLDRVIKNPKAINWMKIFDSMLFSIIPSFRKYARNVLVEYRK